MMKVDPNAAYFPTTMSGDHDGIPIRLAIAAQIMAQLVVENDSLGAEPAADWALIYADALIDAHNDGVTK